MDKRNVSRRHKSYAVFLCILKLVKQNHMPQSLKTILIWGEIVLHFKTNIIFLAKKSKAEHCFHSRFINHLKNVCMNLANLLTGT